MQCREYPVPSASAEEILVWAAAKFAPRLAFATAFGLEGCVLLHIVATRKLPVDVFTLDTGLLFPETYELWKRLEATYGITIRGVKPARTVSEQAQDLGDRLWERQPDRCCELRKLAPLREALSGHEAWITAIRHDQTPDRATARAVEPDRKFGLTKINPLVAWTESDVWGDVHKHSVPFNPLYTRGYRSIGCMTCTTPVAQGEDPRAGRWRGIAKTECGLHNRPLNPSHQTEISERKAGSQ